MISPTTLVTVYRGTSTDSVFGDEVTPTTAVYVGVPATIREVETRRRIEQRWTNVTVYEVYVTVAYTLQVKDVIEDHVGGRYVVERLRSSGSIVMSGQRADCSRIG